MALAKKPSTARSKPRPAAKRKSTVRVAAKPAAKPTGKATAKRPLVHKAPVGPVPRKPAAMPAAQPAAATAKADKPKKPKLVRDSFTIPKAEYTVLADLKERAAKLGRPAKKSELLRAGIKLLALQGDAAFGAALAAVPAIKTGRPAKD
jgi:hypothetical protein